MTNPLTTVTNLRSGSTFRLRGRTWTVRNGCVTHGPGAVVEVAVFNVTGKETNVTVKDGDHVEVVHSVTVAEWLGRP